jgi:transaldolase
MGASFRSKDQLLQLSGCDLLTISPNLLEELNQDTSEITQKLDLDKAQNMNIEKINLTESKFRYLLNDDIMANEKLSEGIRKFSADIIKLENKILSNI